MRSELQPLRVPSGWQVNLNDFFQTDPNYDEPDMEGAWWDFKEDMFQAILGDVTLDLGWYPEFKSCGAYRLMIVRQAEWDNPEVSFESKEKTEIVAKIEELLHEYQRQSNSNGEQVADGKPVTRPT